MSSSLAATVIAAAPLFVVLLAPRLEARRMLGDRIEPIFDAGLVELVEMDRVISAEVRLTPLSATRRATSA